jgi:hypothetical protein
MEIMTWFNCPYCNLRGKYTISQRFTSSQAEVIFCESEDGGCDKPFVLETRLEVKASPRAIVGE